MENSWYRQFGKRTFDFSLAAVLLLVLGIPMLLICLCILILEGRPIFFLQQRPGKYEKIFTLIKFRTMKVERNIFTTDEDDEQRLTKIGRILRKTSLDELPELINILKGEMSFIGPRPLLVYYLPFYTEKEKKRHDVLPGLTGLAQVSGRNRVQWEERLQLDVTYVERISVKEDLKIFFKTLWIVLNINNVDSGKDLKEGDLALIRSQAKPEEFAKSFSSLSGKEL